MGLNRNSRYYIYPQNDVFGLSSQRSLQKNMYKNYHSLYSHIFDLSASFATFTWELVHEIQLQILFGFHCGSSLSPFESSKSQGNILVLAVCLKKNLLAFFWRFFVQGRAPQTAHREGQHENNPLPAERAYKTKTPTGTSSREAPVLGHFFNWF